MVPGNKKVLLQRYGQMLTIVDAHANAYADTLALSVITLCQVSVEQEWAANANAELVDADTTTRAQTAPMLALIIIMRIGVKEGMFKILEARMLTVRL